MTEEEKEPYASRARAQETLRAVRMRLPDENLEAARPMSPWGLGSLCYPCAPATVQKLVEDILPHARPALRTSFEKCMQAATGGADRLVDCVINKVVEFEHKELKKFKASSRTCFQMHPGICCEDPDKSKIVSFHKKLDHALKQICQRREVVGGEHLFLFAGYRRQRDADAAVQRVDALCIKADYFDIAVLGDQPDKRRGFRTWTHCHFVGGDQFDFGTHVGLINTLGQTVQEFQSFRWAKRLCMAAKHFVVHELAFEDAETEVHLMKAQDKIKSNNNNNNKNENITNNNNNNNNNNKSVCSNNNNKNNNNENENENINNSNECSITSNDRGLE